MTSNELIEILKTGLDEQEIQDLNIGKLVKLPGAKGCIKLNNEWFVYGSQDERGNISFNGPFDDSALIYALENLSGVGSARLLHYCFDSSPERFSAI